MQTVQLSTSQCKSGTISWAACRSSSGGSGNTCSLESCDGTKEVTANKCNEVTTISFNVPAGATSMIVQIHDGQFAGTKSCSGVGIGYGKCAGGSKGSCKSATSGVCEVDFDLDSCPAPPPPPKRRQCVENGVTHEDGDTWELEEPHCGTCTCHDGATSCVGCPIVTCVDEDGNVHDNLTPWTTDDGCQACECLESGNIYCYQIVESCNAATGCTSEGGDFVEDGGTTVNECGASCTCYGVELSCEPCDTGECDYYGTTKVNGDEWDAPDNCNDCYCDNGEFWCSVDKICPACEYNGQEYYDGQEFPAGDICNTCYCDKEYGVYCTRNTCDTKPECIYPACNSYQKCCSGCDGSSYCATGTTCPQLQCY
jgi:hypothetical protein